MPSAIPVVLVRLLFPVSAVVFGAFFYRSVQDAGLSERLFPLALIIGMWLFAALVIARELHTLAVARRSGGGGLAGRLDVDGLRAVAWARPALVAGSALLYVVAINRLGLLPTAFLVYVVGAGALMPDRSDRGGWVRCLIAAAVTAVVLDLAFRQWLGLPLPGPLPG